MLMTHYANRVASMERIARFGIIRATTAPIPSTERWQGRLQITWDTAAPAIRPLRVPHTYQSVTARDIISGEWTMRWRKALEQLVWVSPSDDTQPQTISVPIRRRARDGA